MAASYTLPVAIKDEILRRYADVLRVGSVRVSRQGGDPGGGDVVSWDTDTSTELQLRGFCEAFFGKLRGMPELEGTCDAALGQAVYWYCKAVSINYALIEVLLLVKRKVGTMCTIETRQEGGGKLVEYAVQVRGPPVRGLVVSLIWRGKDNIVYRNPVTCQSEVKGTLSCLETEFGIPPEHGFAPAYNLRMRFKKSLARRFVTHVQGAVVCSGFPSEKGKPVFPVERIFIEEPLRTPAFPLDEGPAWPSADSALDSSLGASAACASASAGAAVPAKFSEAAREPSPPDAAASEKSLEDAEPPVGHLRVRLRAPSADSLPSGCARPDPPPARYVQCSVATGGQSRAIAAPPAISGHPGRPEAWDFPVRARDLRGEVVLEILDAQGCSLGVTRILVGSVLACGGRLASSASTSAMAGGSGLTGGLDLELELLPEPAPEPAPRSRVAAYAAGAEDSDSECEVEVGALSELSDRCGPAVCLRPCSPRGICSDGAGVSAGLSKMKRPQQPGTIAGCGRSRGCGPRVPDAGRALACLRGDDDESPVAADSPVATGFLLEPAG